MTAIDAPDSVAIFGWSQEPIIRIYGASMFASSRSARDWNIKNLKRMSDTLRMRIIDAECDKPGLRVNDLWLIGEVDGYHVKIPATVAFQTVTFIDMPSWGWGYLRTPGGGYEKGMVQESCAESKCVWRVRSAQSFRDSVAAAAATKAAAEEKAALNAARARAAAIRAKGWSRKITDDVIGERVAVGMTAEMVRLSWGDPQKVNTTLTASGRSEQWVYRGSYVYLRNGIVTAIQESRAKPRY